jgi:RNA-directed DNA polymerase
VPVVRFLGCNVRQYADRSTRRGVKLLIKPSKEAVRRLKARLRRAWLALRGQPVKAVIGRLNPIIRGWANYYRHVVSKQVFNSLDWWMWGRCVRHARWQHPHKSTGWLSARYWGRWHRQRNDRWVFGDSDTGAYLLKFAWTPIRRHVQVLGASSPDDPSFGATGRPDANAPGSSTGSRRGWPAGSGTCARCAATPCSTGRSCTSTI